MRKLRKKISLHDDNLDVYVNYKVDSFACDYQNKNMLNFMNKYISIDKNLLVLDLKSKNIILIDYIYEKMVYAFNASWSCPWGALKKSI